MSPDSVLHMLQRVLKRAGLPRIRFHDLRHTFATMALQNGVDVKTVSSMLGHYSAGFTLDTYAHVTTDAQLKAAQTMGSILSRAVSASICAFYHRSLGRSSIVSVRLCPLRFHSGSKLGQTRCARTHANSAS